MKKVKMGIVVLIILTIVMSGCTSYKVNKRNLNNSMGNISKLSFDNYVNIDNVEDLGQISASATVSYEENKKQIILKSANFEVIYDKSKKREDIKAGSVFRGGDLNSWTMTGPLSFGSAFANIFKSGAKKNKTASVVKSLYSIAQKEANYRLIEKGIAKGAVAVMYTTYFYDETINADGKIYLGCIDKPNNTKKTYTVKVYAHAVKFKAAPQKLVIK